VLDITGDNFGPVNPIFMVGGVVCSPPEGFDYDGVQQTGSKCVLPSGSGSLKGVNAIQINGQISDGVSLVSYEKCPRGTRNVMDNSLGYFVCEECEPGYYASSEELFTCAICLSGR
jgi:hypothetical protein